MYMLMETRFFDVFSKSIYNLVNDVESITYATKCVLEDFRDDGVRYLELRTTPREIRDEHGDVSISKEEYVLIVLRAIEEFKHHQHQQRSEMSVYLILSIDRARDSSSSAEEVVDIALRHRHYHHHHHNNNSNNKGANPVIVGIDLCGNPTKGNVSTFRSAFHKAQANNLKTTLHFAETLHSTSNSSEELETLLSFAPDRLGHVIHVSDSIKQKIADGKIALELCLSCNVHAKMIQGGFADHHFGYWWDRTECAIALCVCLSLSLSLSPSPLFLSLSALKEIVHQLILCCPDRRRRLLLQPGLTGILSRIQTFWSGLRGLGCSLREGG